MAEDTSGDVHPCVGRALPHLARHLILIIVAAGRLLHLLLQVSQGGRCAAGWLFEHSPPFNVVLGNATACFVVFVVFANSVFVCACRTFPPPAPRLPLSAGSRGFTLHGSVEIGHSHDSSQRL